MVCARVLANMRLRSLQLSNLHGALFRHAQTFIHDIHQGHIVLLSAMIPHSPITFSMRAERTLPNNNEILPPQPYQRTVFVPPRPARRTARVCQSRGRQSSSS